MKINTTQHQNSTAGQSKESDANPLSGLTWLQRDLLRTIAALNKPSGVEIREALESAHGRQVNDLHLYLNKLCDEGFVEKEKYGGGGRSHSYTLTAVGKEAFESHLRWMCSTGGDA